MVLKEHATAAGDGIGGWPGLALVVLGVCE